MTRFFGVSHGFVFRDGHYWNLGPVDYVSDLNDEGLVVGHVDSLPVYWDTSQGAVASLQPTPIPLPLLPAGNLLGPFNQGHAYGVNNAGAIVGSCSIKGFAEFAFLYDGHTSVMLNDLRLFPTPFLSRAVGINDAWEIAGNNMDGTSFRLSPMLVVPQVFPHWSPNAVSHFNDPVGARDPVKHDILIGLELDELAKQISDPVAQVAVRNAILSGVEKGAKQLLENVKPGHSVANHLPNKSVRPTPSRKMERLEQYRVLWASGLSTSFDSAES